MEQVDTTTVEQWLNCLRPFMPISPCAIQRLLTQDVSHRGPDEIPNLLKALGELGFEDDFLCKLAETSEKV